MWKAFLVIVLMSSTSAFAACKATEDDIASLQLSGNCPADIKAFVERYNDCLHFAGEEAYDAERKAEIDKAFDELKCEGLKGEYFKLSEKYKTSYDKGGAVEAVHKAYVKGLGEDWLNP